jgi:hypothetical protein
MADSGLKRWLYGIGRFFRQTLLGRALAFASLPLLLLGIAFYKPHYHPPIFDAQVHYNEESWKRVRVEAIMRTSPGYWSAVPPTWGPGSCGRLIRIGSFPC